MGQEISLWMKLSVSQSLLSSVLKSLWLVTKRIWFWVRAAEISFLCRVTGFNICVKVKSLTIAVDSLCFQIERKQKKLRLFRHLLRSCIRHVTLDGDHGAYPGPDGGIMAHSWLGNIWRFPRSLLWPWQLAVTIKRRMNELNRSVN